MKSRINICKLEHRVRTLCPEDRKRIVLFTLGEPRYALASVCRGTGRAAQWKNTKRLIAGAIHDRQGASVGAMGQAK
jgi:hypothetical protein